MQDSADITAEYNRMMSSFESDVTKVDSTPSIEAAAKASEVAPPNCPWIKGENCSDESSSGSDSSSDEESGSEDESKPKHSGKAKRRGSESTDYSSDSSTATGSGWLVFFSTPSPPPLPLYASPWPTPTPPFLQRWRVRERN